jgi:hypothetical protein
MPTEPFKNRFSRAYYAWYATVVSGGFGMLLVLLIAPDKMHVLFSPVAIIPMFVLSYLAAPWLEARLPIRRKRFP